MFLYPTKAEGSPVAPAPVPLAIGPALAIARRSARLIVAFGIAGAVVAYTASFLVTAKYVSTTEIYIDPSAPQSASAEPVAPGEDSNAFVNYVESQALIVASRSVIERVARTEALDRDPEFSADAAPSIFGLFTRSSREASADPVAAAARVFATHVYVRRPERTFVLDISVSSRNAERAAKLANATAQAYIDEVGHMHADAARQNSAAIAQKLDALRSDVIKAEQAVETYKADNGLIGAKDVSLVGQQLKNLDDQIAAQRAKESDARGRADSAEAARASGGDLGAFAAQFGLTTLGQLRAQQAEARQRLADALADLGPRHPQAIEAQARFDAANKAVDNELDRFARAQRIEYQRAKATEADLQRQFELLKRQTHTDDQAMVGLRDLERKAHAARDVYELFVNRSRDTGEIQEVAPVRTKVISVAAPPKQRNFPPSATALAALGLVGGLALGFLTALAAQAKGVTAATGALKGPSAPPDSEPEQAPAPPPPPAEPSPAAAGKPESASPKFFLLRGTSRLSARFSQQSLDALNLTELGFAALTLGSDTREFSAIVEALHASGDCRVVVITGANDADERTSLAVNLALAAVWKGDRVALIDAAGRNAKLTRAVRRATSQPVLEGGPVFATVNEVRLVLPKAGGAGRGRIRPLQALDELIASDEPFDLILCDGPDAGEIGASEIFARADAIVALDDEETLERLDDLGYVPAVQVRSESESPALKRA